MAGRGAGRQLAKYALAADITDSATTLTVGSAPIEGVAVDDDTLPFVAAIEDSTSNYEAVLVIGISTVTWTIVRAYKSTTGVAHSKDASIQVIDTDVEQQQRAGGADNVYLTSSVLGGQSTGAKAAGTVVVPFDGFLRSVTAFLSTANASSTFIIDFEKNGTDVGPILTIADGATVATKAKAVADIAVTALDRLRPDIDQVGSGTAGSDLSLVYEIERA